MTPKQINTHTHTNTQSTYLEVLEGVDLQHLKVRERPNVVVFLTVVHGGVGIMGCRWAMMERALKS